MRFATRYLHPFASPQTRSCALLPKAPSLLLAVSLFFMAMAGIQAQTPEVGAKVRDFSLATPTGSNVRLSELNSKGPLVLVVLRGFPGYQCPYCTKQVHDFVDHAPEFAARKVNVLLVYPGPPADLDQRAKEFLAQQADLPANITLVTDPDYKVVNQLGLRWDAPRETAYPSTFILDPKGKVLFEKISHSHGDRTSAEDILKQLPA